VQVYLIRHASAEADAADDASRRLTARGQDEARLASRALVQMNLKPTALLTSPLRRCVETASVVAAALDVEVRQERRLAPGFDAGDFASIVEDLPADGVLVLCGHEPDLSGLVTYLTGALVKMPKSGVVRIQVASLRPGACELRWLLRPEQLRLIASARVSA
jgi:phosphohistidine phosphatase